ncbi:polymorphic toxin type 15 domain-containing protein [Stenotrophomonas rhizophila]|uniref:polymorphic toxin type 15 domain-containing protein n=1 Tax=Stenotrophomonas rhizophila TaxID=216778 RepID=UPI0028AAC2C7|nr:PAAR domain-containing protein [Stenotrophomonas rhizophila]
MGRIAIVVGDSTSSGGTVLTGSPFTDINGMAVARVGDKAFCPKHKGAFPIVTGDPTFIVDGQALARHGDALACGCKVLAVKQSTVSVESGGGGAAKGGSEAAASPAAPAAGFVAQGTTAKAPASPPVKQDILLHYHYGDLDRTPVRGVAYQVMLPDDSIRTGHLDDEGRARIPEVTVGPAQMVQVLFQPDETDEDNAPILAARARLKTALDAIVVQTRTDMAPEWQQWDKAGNAIRWGLQRGNQALGMGQGTWDYVAGTVETAVDMAVLMYKADRELKEWTRLLLTGDRDGLDRKIAALRATGGKVMDAASEAKELFNLLIEDPGITEMLPSFGVAWWEAVPPDEQERIEARFSSQIMVDVVVSILLAAVTVELGGAGGFGYAAAKAGNTAARVGKKLLHLMEEVEDAFKGLAKVLKTRKRRQADGNRTPDGGRKIETTRLPKRMPRKKLPCFNTQGLPESKHVEMDRQLKGQEAGLNDMSVDEYLEARKAFDSSNRDKSVARKARSDYKRKIENEKFEELLEKSGDEASARKESKAHANETMKTMHALHNPDLVAGGADQIADFGDGEVNKTIGRQWNQAKKNEKSRLDVLDEAASKTAVGERRSTRMNGGLERCK